MPEGPELFFLSQLLKSQLKNQYFNNIISNTKSIIKLPKKSIIVDIYSYGKNLIIKTQDYNVLIHLGITGWLVLEEPKIYKYILEFSNLNYYLKDVRRFSKITIFNNDELLNDYLNNYEVDILTPKFTYDYFEKIIESKNKLLCNLLLEQKYFSGLGNYIKNDVFYLTKLNINKKTNEMTKNQIKKLYENILFVAYSKLYTWLNEYNLKVPKYIEKIEKPKLEIPYHYKVYEQEYDKKGNKVILIKNHCGRRTYYVPNVQIN